MSENEALPGVSSTQDQRNVPGKTSGPTERSVPKIAALRPSRTFGVKEIPGKLAFSVRDALDNRRLLIALPFAMIIGILAYRVTRFEPSATALTLIGMVLVAALFFNLRKQALPLWVLLGTFWIGFLLLPVHGALFGTGMVRGVFYGTYTAQVDAIHSNDGNRARLIISRIEPVEGARAPPIRRARILVPAEQVPQVGETISAPMRLYKVPGPVVPGGFDSQFQAYFDGIGAFGSITGTLEVLQSPQSINFFRFVQETREAIGNRIDQTLSPPASGIARALIIGDQGQVDEGIRDNLAASGLAHVLAISGLHLSLVAGGVFAAIRMGLAFFYGLGQRVNVKKVAALGGMGAALIYLGLSGASVSAIRATLMLLLVFGAVLAGRRALTMRNVAFAALFVIIIDPASIFRPSFQLSFAAVTALVGAYEGYRRQRSDDEGWLKKLFNFSAGIALTSIIAGAATALFAAYHFQQIAPLGALGNMVAIPLVAFIVLPAALIAVLLMPLGIEPVFLQVMGWGIEQIVAVAAFVAGLSDGFVSAPILGSSALVIGFLALGWFAFFPGRLRIVGLLAAIPLLLAFGRLPPPDVMIADTTQAVAVREEGGLFLISGRSNTFATNAWGETYLEPITGASENVNCDALGCIAQRENFILALVKGRDAFGEDCEAADLVVARIPAPAFCATLSQVIDKDDLEQKGVHWARWMGEEFWIRPAIVDINRPWRPQY